MSVHEISPETFEAFGFFGYGRDAQRRLVPVRECLPTPPRIALPVAPVPPPVPPVSTELALAIFHRSLRHLVEEEGLGEEQADGLIRAYLALARREGVGEAVATMRERRAFALGAYLPEATR